MEFIKFIIENIWQEIKDFLTLLFMVCVFLIPPLGLAFLLKYLFDADMVDVCITALIVQIFILNLWRKYAEQKELKND